MTFALKLTPAEVDDLERLLPEDDDLAKALSDWRTLVAEIERLQARLDAIGTVTDGAIPTITDIQDAMCGKIAAKSVQDKAPNAQEDDALHERGKFGGPLAEQYVEQTGGAESDATKSDVSDERLIEMKASLKDNVTLLSHIRYSTLKLIDEEIARRAITPDPRDAQIAKLREALKIVSTALAKCRGSLSWRHSITDAALNHPTVVEARNAARVLEEARG